jgi:Flp pilus assembly protein TadG
MMRARRGAVSLLFATAIIPMLMMIGLAVDYGMYSEAQAQLNTAADTASMHAARVASELLQKNDPEFRAKGKLAGQKWFAAQLGNLPQAAQSVPGLDVVVSYAPATKAITAKVTYSDIIVAHFGKLFPDKWPHWPNWDIAGTATAVISVPAYVEVLMLLDNSSSMLIGATPADILALELRTPCSTQSVNEGQGIDADYSWAYTAQPDGTWLWNPLSSTLSNIPAPGATDAKLTLPYGYGYAVYTAISGPKAQQDVVPPAARVGNCDGRYSGDPSACFYPGTIPGLSATGQCPYKGGSAGSEVILDKTVAAPPYKKLIHFPQAPCAFACHNDNTGAGNDYWGLAQKYNITTRYRVLHQAAADVIQKMQTNPTPGQLSIGVYQFTEKGLASPSDPGVSVVYPENGNEAGPVAGTGGSNPATLTANIEPPITGDRPDTNFENAMTYMDSVVSKAGDGLTAASPQKNLFIVTDGMDDYYVNNDPNAQRIQQPIDPAACANLKNAGVKIYVLYTKYYPLPNPYYLQNDLKWAEAPGGGLTPIETAMAACSSNSATDSQNYFYEAKEDKGDIDRALKAMLAAAIGSAGRLSN